MEERIKNEQLLVAIQEAKLDALTGLYNQRAIKNLAKHLLSNQVHKPVAFLFLDIDNFKSVNDTLGHLRGDTLLVDFAKQLTELINNHGIVGRIGGDEFLIFLTNAENKQVISEYAGEICSNFLSLKQEPQKLPVSCSVGISVYPFDGTGFEELLNKADQALYNVKRHGKNDFFFYSEELQTIHTSVLSEIESQRNKEARR